MMPFQIPLRTGLLAVLLLAGPARMARPADTNAPAAKPGTNAVVAVPESPANAAPSTNAPAVARTNAPVAETASGSRTNATRKIEFADFRIVGDRNIFNPNRSARTSRAGRAAPRKVVRIETFNLVGVMNYDRGDLAFFDSAAAAYRKSVRTNETIAGYRVAAVTPTEVKLEAGGKTLVARVGTRFRRADEGPWEMILPGGTPAPEPKTEAAPADGSTDTEPTSDDAADKTTSSGGTSGEVSDVLKRLMQKREQETKNEKQ
jgi:hypothetical protein